MLYSLSEDKDLVTVRDWNSLSLRSDGQNYLSQFPEDICGDPVHKLKHIPSPLNKGVVAVNQTPHHSSQ